MKTADKILESAAETFRERNKVYGDNYKNVGQVMKGLFPDGVTLLTEEDHNRFHLLFLDVVKLTRYCNNWEKGGHQDSIHDSIVYGAMLESIDSERCTAGEKSQCAPDKLSSIPGGFEEPLEINPKTGGIFRHGVRES